MLRADGSLADGPCGFVAPWAALPGARAVYDAIALVETFVDHQDQQRIDHIDALPAAGGAAAAPLRGLLRRLNLDNEICIKSTAEVRISHRCSRS